MAYLLPTIYVFKIYRSNFSSEMLLFQSKFRLGQGLFTQKLSFIGSSVEEKVFYSIDGLQFS